MIKERAAKETEAAKTTIFSSLSYDPETGDFRWKVAGKNTVGIGHIAGTMHHSGYRHIKVGNVRFSSQRLAWLFHTGEWPKENIDHINTKKSDNRICNLREASFSQNGFNMPMMPYNTSGFKGVSFSSREKRYRAQITAYGKRHYLGLFDDPKDAAEAYKSAAARLHGEFARTESACLDKVKEMNQ